MESYRSIIERWPTPADFAADIGIDASHARAMKTRNSIPPSYWDNVVSAAEKRDISDVSLKLLVGLSKPKPAPAPRSAGQNRRRIKANSTKRSAARHGGAAA